MKIFYLHMKSMITYVTHTEDISLSKGCLKTISWNLHYDYLAFIQVFSLCLEYLNDLFFNP